MCRRKPPRVALRQPLWLNRWRPVGGSNPGVHRERVVSEASRRWGRGACPATFIEANGGARRDRTADLLHAMQALSQLSYGPTRWTARTFNGGCRELQAVRLTLSSKPRATPTQGVAPHLHQPHYHTMTRATRHTPHPRYPDQTARPHR